ncbi:hypothetical protein EDD76_11360 [Kineothrix alysoides]|uniref:Uncharacterized protein n=1 Tax=Kineothrix alysoides TaxID=1469948 RepID=A0A4R1QQ19_9FIRM|nr:hypothetical protein [Kineothrix alysoides]TCL55926.1 hypothetical protein EDD76_11360 [Kineothrix alysoides]
MAKVMVKTAVEGNIDKFDAFRALCEELGLNMLTGNKLNEYVVEAGTLYKYIDSGYEGKYEGSEKEKELVSSDYRMVTLFESLLIVKSLI